MGGLEPRRVSIAEAVIVVAIVLVVLVLVLPAVSTIPHYQGRPIVVWGNEANSHDAAVRSHAVGVLIDALENGQRSVRSRVPWSLVRGADDPRVVPALIAATHDDSADVRVAAIDALGSLPEHKEAIAPALTEALQDKNRSVRAAAARALQNIGVDHWKRGE